MVGFDVDSLTTAVLPGATSRSPIGINCRIAVWAMTTISGDAPKLVPMLLHSGKIVQLHLVPCNENGSRAIFDTVDTDGGTGSGYAK
jgi:hypothetical protein